MVLQNLHELHVQVDGEGGIVNESGVDKLIDVAKGGSYRVLFPCVSRTHIPFGVQVFARGCLVFFDCLIVHFFALTHYTR